MTTKILYIFNSVPMKEIGRNTLGKSPGTWSHRPKLYFFRFRRITANMQNSNYNNLTMNSNEPITTNEKKTGEIRNEGSGGTDGLTSGEAFSSVHSTPTGDDKFNIHHKEQGTALTHVFGNMDVLLNISLFVVLPLPFLCKEFTGEKKIGCSFNGAFVFALSLYDDYSYFDTHFFLENASSSLFMLQLVKRKPAALQYASAELKGDREIVMEAVKQCGCALHYASAQLQGDREIVMEAVKQRWWALEYASTELKGDREIVIEAVKLSGNALEYASAKLQGDREIVMEAMKQNGLAQ